MTKTITVLATLTALVLLSAPVEGRVFKSDDFQTALSNIKKIAVSPSDCGAVQFPCEDLDKWVFTYLRWAWKPWVVPAQEVGAAELNAKDSSDDSLLVALGADSILRVKLVALRSENDTPKGQIATGEAKIAYELRIAGRAQPIAKGEEDATAFTSYGAVERAVKRALAELFDKK